LNDLGMDAALEVVVVFGELIRRGGEWVFSANSAGFPGGLDGLCRQYGVSV
jgi:stress response protein SCP2